MLFGDSFLHQVLHFGQIFNTVKYGGTEYPPHPELPLLTSLMKACDVNARNKKKQTPLHLISEQVWQSVQGWRTLDNPTSWENAVQILTDHGAHLDMLCDGGVEAGHGLASRWSRFNFVPSLSCQSSRVIVEKQLQYGQLPKQVQEYIALHEGKLKNEQQILEERKKNRLCRSDKALLRICEKEYELNILLRVLSRFPSLCVTE